MIAKRAENKLRAVFATPKAKGSHRPPSQPARKLIPRAPKEIHRMQIVKVGIYGEQNDVLFGGTDSLVAAIAEALAPHYQVEIVHHCASLSRDQLAEFALADLARVGWRYVPMNATPWYSWFRNPVRRYREARERNADWSKPYDLFIYVGHEVPVFCHAGHGMLLSLFPLFKPGPFESWSWEDNRFRPLLPVGKPWANRLRRYYYAWEWRQRLATYQLQTAISQFTGTWMKRWWGVDPEVIYPPVACPQFRVTAKENRILSVGRFATQLHQKKQAEMVATFRGMEERGLQNWDYDSVGGLNNCPADREFFESVRRLGEGGRVHVRANVARPELIGLFERAKVFWHAAGYGLDEAANPQLSEHFGIATIEAMAAGCVPVVVNRGAQPEIVQHGKNGFVWNTLDELAEYTLRLTRDEQLRESLAEEARRRAQDFSRDRLAQRLQELLARLV
jgi:glycosyltransferase involved in cell wall biosynthesis